MSARTKYLLLCLLFFVSAGRAQQFYLQLSAGNNYFISAQTPISGFSPMGDLTLIYSGHYDGDESVNGFLGIRFRYNYSVQYYKAYSTTYSVSNNEYLFGLGGARELKKNRHSLMLQIFLELGPTFANTNQPYMSQSITAGFTGRRSNIREFYQFYLSTGLHYGLQLSKRFTTNFGMRGLVYLFENDVGDLGIKGTNILFNYAPIKISPYFGLQFSL